MAEQKILISININDKQATQGMDKLSSATKRLSDLQKQEAVDLARVNEQIKIQKDLNIAAAKSSLGLAQSTSKVSAAVKQGRAQSGLNNAILLETGRLASDASYGFTAIANNLSQVTSLFGSFVKTQGGVIASFKALGKSLLGSGGFLIAIQLLISFGPQVFQFFERLLGFTRELREAFKGASGTVKESTGAFELYVRTLQDSSKSQEEQKDAIESLNKEFPDYVKQLKDAKLSLNDVAKQTEEATKITDKYREAILKQAMSRQAQIKIEESAGNIIELQVEKEAKARDNGYSSLLEAEERYKELSKKKTDGRLNYKENAEIYWLRKLVELNDEEIQEENKKIDRLIEFADIEVKERKKRGGKRERDFKQQLLNLDKLEEDYRQKSIDQTLLTEDEKINQQEKFAKKELDNTLKAFKERQELRLEEFKESGASKAEIAKATKEYNQSIELAEQEHTEVMVELTNSFDTKRSKLKRKRAEDAATQTQKARDTQREIEEQALDDLKTFDTEANTLFFEANANFIEKLLERQKAIIDNEKSTVDQVATARKEQFELQRQLRENDLNGELAAIEAKKLVNLEYVGFAESIGSTLSNLAGENESLAKAALVVEKGAAIAKVIINAQSSILAKTAAANAVPSVLPPGIPNPAFAVAKAEAVKSNTRTKVGAALAIANILSTMIGKKGGGVKDGGGGSGGGGTTIQAPDFNVVGASETSQLAQTVATSESQPIKAFVVGKDISTQQELDRNITNTASFG